MIHITFACGHTTEVSDRAVSAPRCSMCGMTQIVRSTPSRPPRFVGIVTGPHAEYLALDPGVVNVAPNGPLTLTDKE